MAPQEIQEESLGEKHKNYNKLLQEAIANNSNPNVNTSNVDIKNLLKIDIACKNKDVDYILEVYKSEDMLYVSRAIKHSQWLITDSKYAHIINSKYLRNNLFPYMTTKATNKLLLSIRLNIKDEKRAEQFYKDIKEKSKHLAFKWLENCSLKFIENEVRKHAYDIPCHILIRLFRKSISIFDIIVKSDNYYKYKLLEDSQFLAKRDPEKYLDILETKPNLSVTFSSHTTELLMKKCPQRILKKIDIYFDKINVPAFAKSFKQLDAKDFIFEQLKNEKLSYFSSSHNIEHFLNLLPKEDRFDFVKKMFIDREPVEINKDHAVNKLALLCAERHVLTNNQDQAFKWYKYAPFDIAFADMKKLIKTESNPYIRMAMFRVLLQSAGQDMKNLHTLLQYYHDKHINEAYKFKIQFINTFVTQIDTHKFDNETWQLLTQLFHSVEVYIESNHNVQTCVIAIIVRNVLRGEPIPEIIHKKFTFSTLKSYATKLTDDKDKDVLFTYLFNHLKSKIDFTYIKNVKDFSQVLNMCENLFTLLKHWKKDLGEYPFAINCVKEIYKIKKLNNWNTDLSTLYNIKKSWRKYMFEESLIFDPSDRVCVNALKHDPNILIRHKDQIIKLCSTDYTMITQLLKKVRIYWPNTLASELRKIYFEGIETSNGHKALISGICTLLTQHELKEFAEKYVPSEAKINWKDTDETALSLRKQIARNLRKARPLVPLDVVLLYAKGDYLQFAVPSLDSVLSQMSVCKITPRLNHLLDAPVSLQKFGIRYAYLKLKSQEATEIYSHIWKSNKNPSIKMILLKKTHALLCKEENTSNINALWTLLQMYIDDLKQDENKDIYLTLSQCSKIPTSIKTDYFKKCYTFLKELPKGIGANLLDNMKYDADEVLISLDDEYVINVILDKLHENVTENKMISSNSDCMIKFILFSENEDKQMRRYDALLKPFLDHNLPNWYKCENNDYITQNFIKSTIRKFLHELLNLTIKRKMCVPVKVIAETTKQIEKYISIQKDYIFITSWKLSTEFVKSIEENKDVYMNHELEKLTDEEGDKELQKLCVALHNKIAPKFTRACVKLLLDDCRESPSLYSLFSKSLANLFNLLLMRNFMTTQSCTVYYREILQCGNEKEIHLMMYPIIENCIRKTEAHEDDENLNIIKEILFNHPSPELKFHYYLVYNTNPDM